MPDELTTWEETQIKKEIASPEWEKETNKPINKLEKLWLKAVFWGGWLALVSEPLANNGVDTTITNTCLAAGTVIMIAGCVALILSERKPKTTKPYPLLDH